MMLNILPAIPEIFLTGSALVLLLVGVVFKRYSYQITITLALFSLLCTGYLLLMVVPTGDAFYGTFHLDLYAIVMKLLILGCSIICLLLGISYQLESGLCDFEYIILMCTSILGMMLMVSGETFLTVYMGLELQSLSFYILAAFKRHDAYSSESGLKYFVLGSIASGFFLYGISLIYGFTGNINFKDLMYLFSLKPFETSEGIIFGIVFMLSGLLFKLSAVPFHMWTPDVYEGSPMPITLFFSTVPKIAGFALLIRILFEPFYHMIFSWYQIILFVSAASMIWAAFAGIMQIKIKRLIAYSSIGNVGYALIGLLPGTSGGIASVLLYISIYAFSNLGLFGCLLYMRSNGKSIEYLSDLSGLHKTNPSIALMMMIILLSLSGIPPLAGFIAKLLIFQEAITYHFYVLAIIGILSSVVASFYYLRIIKIMYFDPNRTAVELVDSHILPSISVLVVSVIATLSVYVNPILELFLIASRSLHIH